jgi:hypothetical protein
VRVEPFLGDVSIDIRQSDAKDVYIVTQIFVVCSRRIRLEVKEAV